MLLDLLITNVHWVPTNSEPSKADGRGDNRDVDEPFKFKLTSLTWTTIRLNGFSWGRTDSGIIFIGTRNEDSRSETRFFIHNKRFFRAFNLDEDLNFSEARLDSI